MKIHEYANLSRRMDADEFERLKASILSVGQLQPIIIKAGAIVDGRHRYLACEELGIEPHYREADTEELLEAAIAANQVRKQDTKAQRAMNAATLTDLDSEQGHPPAPGKLSLRKAAELYGVSVTHIRNARLALLYGSDELVEAIKTGTLGLPRDEAEVSQMEAVIHREKATVQKCTVDEGGQDSPKDSIEEAAAIKEIKRLQRELKAAKARDRRDSEQDEIAKTLAEAQAEVELIRAENAALKAATPDAAVLELAKPKVVIQKDVIAERELKEARAKLEEAVAAKKRADHDVLQHQKFANETLAENLALKGQLAKVENATEAFSIFGRHVLTWRSDAKLTLSILRKNPQIIDMEVEKCCKEVGQNLLKVADQLADNRAAPGRATVTQLQIA